jgi:YVTN family beta-propeller protein
MQIFSPDGQYGYVCSSFNPETDIVSVATHQIVGRVKQESPFCPNIAATPDGKQVWLTLKDVGKTMIFDARPPFAIVRSIETGPITNHVNFARNSGGQFAYVTVGGLNEVKVFRTDEFTLVATIPVGKLPHGVWPSGDGTRIYVGLENDDALAVIDTTTNAVVGNIPIGQAPQAIAYVPNAVPEGDGTQGLQPLGLAGESARLSLAPVGRDSSGKVATPPTSVALFDQGLLQVLQVSASGLAPSTTYVLALARKADGSEGLEPLSKFTTNPAGAAIVNTIGPLRELVRSKAAGERRYLVIAPLNGDVPGSPVQVQSD